MRIIQSIPSLRAEPFKRWLAQVGYERIREIEAPELASARLRALYEAKGYPKAWIEKRLRSIAIRGDLTDEWKQRDVQEGKEYYANHAVPVLGGEGELVLYAIEDGFAQLYLRAEDGTAWQTKAELAELFQSSKQNISLHIKNILAEGEQAESTVKFYLTVHTEGARRVRRKVSLYRLEMILAVGYRVKSPRGNQFRQWATAHLKEYLVKGFVMDDQRLKDPAGWDYFDELLEPERHYDLVTVKRSRGGVCPRERLRGDAIKTLRNFASRLATS